MRARVTWISNADGGRETLPSVEHYSTVARFPEDRWPAEAWSVVLTFAPPPTQQGNPSIGEVRFLADGAPQER